jgi:transposase-like protein
MPDRPHCPKCDTRLKLTAVVPVVTGIVRQSFQCPRCDYSQQVDVLDRVKPVDGWQIDPPNVVGGEF